jgi:hypothetical protein
MLIRHTPVYNPSPFFLRALRPVLPRPLKLPGAVLAESPENGPAKVDTAVSGLFLHFRQVPQGRPAGTGKILHPAAAAADKVGMGGGIAVKAFLPVYHPHRGKFSLRGENANVPVYRSQGQIRNPGLEPVVHPPGARMGGGGPYGFQNGLALFAVLSHSPYTLDTLNNNDNYYYITIMDFYQGKSEKRKKMRNGRY